MNRTLRVEAEGESVAEAKWNALRQLALLARSLDRSAVSFEVLSDGDRGLLGVGFRPARVAASATVEGQGDDDAPRAVEESDAADRIRRLLERVTAALGISCRIEIEEDAESLRAVLTGDELGLLIGRHGQTLDALQVLAGAMAARGGQAREVAIDAAGYRARRRAQLEQLALRGVDEVRRTGVPAELEPMSAAERKLVHTYLEGIDDVRTASEGAEPHRRVVVEPA